MDKLHGDGHEDDFEFFAEEARRQFDHFADALVETARRSNEIAPLRSKSVLQHSLSIILSDTPEIIDLSSRFDQIISRGDLLIYTARLMEAAFTIGITCSGTKSAKQLLRFLEDVPDRGKRGLGIRRRIIDALQKLYVDDPIKAGHHAAKVTRAVEEIVGETVSRPSLDRARTDLWPQS